MYSFSSLCEAFSFVEMSKKGTGKNLVQIKETSFADWIDSARANIDWHENTLRAVGHLISKGLADEAIHAVLDTPLTVSGYSVKQTQDDIQSMIDSGRRKWAEAIAPEYDPRQAGPVALGFTKTGDYAFLDQVRSIIITASSSQLLSAQYLMGIAESSFWAEQFPVFKRAAMFDFIRAGEALIAACRKRGPFNPNNVRGRGVWLEGHREIVNLGEPIPPGTKYLYLCFEPIPIQYCNHFDTPRLLAFFRMLNWRNQQDAMLLLGWVAIAPICGVLKQRPHCFVSGPPKCGKTTLHRTISCILTPLCLAPDGQSSEAGIRQMIGPDSLPVVIDEFESDHSQYRLKGIIKLARSAYSADTILVRGTAEGKAMQFSLRTIFYLTAVNPIGMEPADETRFIMLDIEAHNSDASTAARIAEDEAFFADKGPEWCGYMAAHVGLVNPAMGVFLQAMPSLDSRHRDNMATLLAGSFVALNGRVPTAEEAKDMVSLFEKTITRHGENLDRNDDEECLNYLLSHIVEGNTLGQFASRELHRLQRKENDFDGNNRRVLGLYGLKVKNNGEDAGLHIMISSSNLEKVFSNTKWGGGAWQRALRKVDGAFSPHNPTYISGAKKKARCICLPLDVIPEMIDSILSESNF